MKSIYLIAVSLTAVLFGRIPMFSTANAAAGDSPTPPASSDIPPEFQKQLDAQAAQIADLTKKLEAQSAAPVAPADTSMLAMLAKGAGVDLEDVRWRIQGGLDPETAVQAALAQKEHDAKVAADAKEALKKKK